MPVPDIFDDLAYWFDYAARPGVGTPYAGFLSAAFHAISVMHPHDALWALKMARVVSDERRKYGYDPLR